MSLAEARDLLARLYAALDGFHAGGGPGPLRELLTGDVVWRVPGRSAVAGEHHGLDAALRHLARHRDLAAGTVRLTCRAVLAGDDGRIAALTDGRATLGGRDVTWSAAALHRVRDGRIAACHVLPCDPVAFDALWPAPAGGPAHVAGLRPRPRHCDAQGIVHAARYYEFFEDAFLGWLDEHAGGYARLRAGTGTDLVVVSSGCDHASPARLDDRLTITARPARRGRTSLTMTYEIHRGGTLVVTGRTTYVAVAAGAPTPLPAPLTAALDRP
ncbi:nuclear transport factor 2 family protein [Actinomadura sp. ATCC 31491]|uniref:Nuclear transport factor 2 family protein n=1 Tax=Actinomadura luzonensis TaxID=2805427 RepID=A0ABT0FUW7_9ACTN|nr:hotdog domain-containing protein [Actinomadura luzonensis]MCK2215775.1 nuclear transport factor 2 family protein [Actinomadura luzonensis]